MAMKNQNERYGTFIHSNENLNVGIDLKIDESRPLVIAHPAAGNHYHASMSFVQEFDHPFIHLVIDLHPYFPDTWPGMVSTSGNFMKYQRINDTIDGHPVFRICDSKQPHWQVQVTADAEEYLNSIPLVDILYLDWIDWINIGDNIRNKQVKSLLDYVSKFVRRDGLIIFDHKHDLKRILSFKETEDKLLDFYQQSSSQIGYSGELEWLGENSVSELTAYSASMYIVGDNGENKKVNVTDFQKWIRGLVPEFAQSKQQIESAIKSGRNQFEHVDAYTWDVWNCDYIQKLTDDISHVNLSNLVPAMNTWDLEYYQKFLGWLKINNHLLTNPQKIRSYVKINQPHIVNIIHGDLIELSPLLFKENNFIAVRKSLAKKVLNRCPWWVNNMVKLQASRPWMESPIPNLVWSGEDVTTKLIEDIMDLSYSKFIERFDDFDNIPDSLEVITVANGNGVLKDLLQSFEKFLNKSKFPDEIKLSLTVVHLDDFDYQENTLPDNWFRS